jgi:hypothetical protein
VQQHSVHKARSLGAMPFQIASTPLPPGPSGFSARDAAGRSGTARPIITFKSFS